MLLGADLTQEKLDQLERDVISYKNNNDQLQKLSDVEDEVVKPQVEKISGLQSKLILSIKNNMEYLEKKVREAEHKTKFKKYKTQMTKEQQRYEKLSEDFQNMNTQKYSPYNSQIQYQKGGYQDQVRPMAGEQQLIKSTFTQNVTLDNLILKQNQEDLQYIEENAQALQKLTQEVAKEVDGQDLQIDIIQYNQGQTKDNVIKAGEQLNKANEYSQNSKKWIWTLLILVLMITLVSILIVVIKKYT